MKRLLGLMVLGILCGGTACKKVASPNIPAAGTKVKIPTEVLKDFVMNDSKNGMKSTSLISTEGRIYEADQYADVDQPLVYFYKDGKESSRLKAPEGRVYTETHDVDCWGGVTVVSSDSSTLTTDKLHYDSKRQKITSEDAVRLEKPDSITDGIGFETDPGLVTVKIGHQIVHFKKGMKE